MKSKYAVVSFIAWLLMSSVVKAQDFQGKAVYQSKTSIDMDNFGRREISEEQKKAIAERMRSMLEKTYELTFNRQESLYKEEEKLETPGGGMWRGMMGSFTAGTQYKNVKENKLLQAQEFFGKQFLIVDSLPKLDWKMESETKQIGQYTCYKATAVKTPEIDFESLRRRNRSNDAAKSTKDSTATSQDETPKQQIITAWYTPQIPINQGPGDYWGLPGLILEVNDGRTTVLCSKIIINPELKEDLKKPSKGKQVTKAEYQEIVKEKIEEMQSYRRSRRGGRHF